MWVYWKIRFLRGVHEKPIIGRNSGGGGAAWTVSRFRFKGGGGWGLLKTNITRSHMVD